MKNRRATIHQLMTGIIFFPAALFLLSTRPAGAAMPEAVMVDWLGKSVPLVEQGISWGVPWAPGMVTADQEFALSTGEGVSMPLQTWPLAYWPDGSIKWLGCATVAGPGHTGPLKLAPGKASASAQGIEISESETDILINTGALSCRIPRKGGNLVKEMIMDGKPVAGGGHLECILEQEMAGDGFKTIRMEDFRSEIQKVTIEQAGPVRAVVHIEGVHKSVQGEREWLPFSVRLYFYAGVSPVRMVHTVIFDGNEQEDFIRGLGIVFSVHMREEIHNRHVRFSGEDGGVWAEPIQPMIGRGGWFVSGGDGRDLYPDQLAGLQMPGRDALDQRGRNLLGEWAVWTGFRLVQPNANGFVIDKRTNARSCWLPAGAGKRASGLVFAGDVSGGMAIGIKDFWQSYPSSLEVQDADRDAAVVKAWLWSPDGPAMDMRHYDTLEWGHGLEAVYEDVQPGFSTPYGVARTSVLTLFPSGGLPGREETVRQSQSAGQAPLLVCSPEYLHAAGSFGIWSLPDRSTPFKKAVEERLDGYLDYYLKSVDQRNWYGFWDYGDVMHSYDRYRHAWRYDLGGMAWDNTELGTDVWLWYSFLRTGREDVFRMAEAMTRHTTEVDCYHMGRFAGLGSRHNVRHWGCGAKELRISQASYRRFYYYLTCDERTGDAMHEVADADLKLLEVDPMRLASPLAGGRKKYPARARGGPDWLAAVSNWMTEWERTGDTAYRDKIVAGMDCIAGMPYGFLSGPDNLFGYDPASNKLYTLTDDPFGTYNLSTIMGGAEVVFELNRIIDHPGWDRAWLQYCRLYNAPKEVVKRDMETGTEGADGSYARPDRLAAYAYMRTGIEAFVKPALSMLLGRRGPSGLTPDRISGPDVLNPVDELPWVGTNGAAQSSLIAIEVLEMCAGKLPFDLPEQGLHGLQGYYPYKAASNQDPVANSFQELMQLDWKEVFHDRGDAQWEANWSLDGDKAKILCSGEGMEFYAGPVPAEDASHAVLWTRKSFGGDVKVEYEFTRLDSALKYVNILYLYAAGSGAEGYPEDILEWSEKRSVPAMKIYFDHMNLLHISYAAFENSNSEKGNDYIRARRYLPETGMGLEGTELMPAYFRTGLFRTGEPHRIVVIKYENDLYMQIGNHENEMRCHWDLSGFPVPNEGRIGLRHMGGRAARYKDFTVCEIAGIRE
jgi:hypothetical protein